MAERGDGQTEGGKKVIEDFKAARRAEREALWAWLQHAYQEGEQPTTREQPYRFALLAAMKGDCGKEMSREALKKARAYLAAIERRTEAMRVARTTFGI